MRPSVVRPRPRIRVEDHRCPQVVPSGPEQQPEVDVLRGPQRVRFLIIRDHKENRQKCTLSPLKGRAGYEFLDLEPPASPPVIEEIGGGILLAIDAPVMTRSDRRFLDRGTVTLVDATWARVPNVLARVRTAPGQLLVRRSLPEELVTAYPRVSKLYKDPGRGLSSIEAVFATLAVLGAPDLTVLDEYRWRTQFLEQNDLTWERSGWDPHSRPSSSSLYGR